MSSGTLIESPKRRPPPAVSHPANRDPAPRIYTCPDCRCVLRVSGLGRHRVYFELGDERSENPVMNRACPTCGHGLPGKNRPW